MTSNIFFFQLNDLLFDEWVANIVKEVNVKEVLKSSIFVVQKATAPKDGVEFCQGSIGTIKSSLAMSYDAWRRRQFSTNQMPRNYLTQTYKLTNSQTDKLTQIQHTVRPCSTSSACKNTLVSICFKISRRNMRPQEGQFLEILKMQYLVSLLPYFSAPFNARKKSILKRKHFCLFWIQNSFWVIYGRQDNNIFKMI